MKLILDGVFIQLASTGIARVWSSILPRLANIRNLEITLLNRGGSPQVPGIRQFDFPSYSVNTNTADDSLLVDRVCIDLGADVFMSTYYTTPLSIPSVLLVHDMIPEVLGFNLNQRPWQEKQIAVSFASYYACVSAKTRADLIDFYPAANNRAIVTHCGVERTIFYPRAESEVLAFRCKYGISRPYYITVGSRGQPQGYKNASRFFRALRKFRDLDIDVVCIGGEPSVDPEFLSGLPQNVSVRHIILDDDDLARAYCGAESLVFPSLYEGFGLPVIEAMSCGCPVIATKFGSLEEVAGNATIAISGHNDDEIVRGIRLVRDPSIRSRLKEAGFRQATTFDWDRMVSGIFELLCKAKDEATSPAFAEFRQKWKRLRSIQAQVDTFPLAKS